MDIVKKRVEVIETASTLITEVVINNYPDKVLIAKEIRGIFYVSEGSKVRGRKKIPKTFLDKSKYHFDNRGVLINTKTGKPLLANPRNKGKERYWNVNFQEIWNGATSGAARAAKTNLLKDILRPHFDKVKPIKQYPVRIEIFIFDTKFTTDALNKGVIYTKIIEDLLVTTKKLEDDSPEYVNDTGRIKLIKITNTEERKMVVRIHKSNNEFECSQ